MLSISLESPNLWAVDSCLINRLAQFLKVWNVGLKLPYLYSAYSGRDCSTQICLVYGSPTTDGKVPWPLTLKETPSWHSTCCSNQKQVFYGNHNKQSLNPLFWRLKRKYKYIIMSGQKPNNIAKEAAFQLVAGGAAGIIFSWQLFLW